MFVESVGEHGIETRRILGAKLFRRGVCQSNTLYIVLDQKYSANALFTPKVVMFTTLENHTTYMN